MCVCVCADIGMCVHLPVLCVYSSMAACLWLHMCILVYGHECIILLEMKIAGKPPVVLACMYIDIVNK